VCISYPLRRPARLLPTPHLRLYPPDTAGSTATRLPHSAASRASARHCCSPAAAALAWPLGGLPRGKGRELKMRRDGVIDGILAQEIAPKGAGMVAVELRGSGLLNRGECVGRRGGPQLGQARGALVLILAAEVLVLLRSAPLFTLARRSGHALLGLLILRLA